MLRPCIAQLLLVAATCCATAQSLPVPSYWQNQRGSQMSLYSMDAQGHFTGTYVNHAAGFACQNSPFAVAGQSNGAVVTFTVIWNNGILNCNSNTVWRGRVTGNTMRTLWVLRGTNIPPLRGKDIFQRQQ